MHLKRTTCITSRCIAVISFHHVTTSTTTGDDHQHPRDSRSRVTTSSSTCSNCHRFLTTTTTQLFYLTRRLSVYERHLNFHFGTNPHKHAVLMYLHTSNDGRNTVKPHDHYVLRLRLHQKLINKLPRTAILTSFNRHYVNCSLCIEAELNLLFGRRAALLCSNMLVLQFL